MGVSHFCHDRLDPAVQQTIDISACSLDSRVKRGSLVLDIEYFLKAAELKQ
jgi:hypothetical protein